MIIEIFEKCNNCIYDFMTKNTNCEEKIFFLQYGVCYIIQGKFGNFIGYDNEYFHDLSNGKIFSLISEFKNIELYFP